MLEQAIKIFNESKFDEALVLFTDLLSQENVSVHHKIKCFKYAKKIQKALHKEQTNLLSQKFIEQLIEEREYRFAYEILIDWYNLNKATRNVQSFFLKYLWTATLFNGLVQESWIYFYEYLDFVASNKKFKEGLLFIEIASKQVKLPEEIYLIQLEYALESGEKGIIDDVCTECFLMMVEKVTFSDKKIECNDWSKFKKFVQGYSDIVSRFELFKEVQEFYQFLLFGRLVKILPENDFVVISLRQRKEFVNGIFEFVTLFGITIKSLLLFFIYARFFGKKNILNLVKTNIDNFVTDDRFSRTIISYINKYMPDLDAFVGYDFKDDGSEIDLGQDLFEKTKTVSGLLNKRKQIENDIELLIKTKDHTGLQVMLKKLKEIDPASPLINLYEEITEKGQDSFKKENLFKELSENTNTNTLIKTLDEKVIEENLFELIDDIEQDYEEVLISLMQMDFYSAALKLIKNIEKTLTLELDKVVALKFIRIDCLIKSLRYHESIIEIDSLLVESPLLQEEILCVLYLKGEAYRFLGDKTNALNSYRNVKKIDPEYRLVLDRIKNLEIDK